MLFTQGFACSATHCLYTMLFRGQRRSRAHMAGFNKADGHRLGAYLRSSSMAWPLLLRSSCALVEALCDPDVFEGPCHPHCHRACRDVWSFHQLALQRAEAATAILALGDDALMATAAELKWCLRLVGAVEDRVDVNSVVDGNVAAVAAMLSHWCTKLGVCPGFEEALGLRGERLALYTMIAKPMAAVQVEEGRTATMEEAQEFMQRGLSNGARNKERKKSGKKGSAKK